MVSDQEIASCVESLLRQARPGSAATVAGVVQQLQDKLGVDLSHKAAFIRDQIDLLLGPPRPPKDHFALHPHPQFHPGSVPHHLQIPAASAFTHLPQPHELTFRYPAPPPPSMPAATMAHKYQHQLQNHHHQQQQLPQQQLPQQPAPVVPVPAIVRPAAAPAPSPKESASVGAKRRGGPGGLSKVCGVSPELQAIVGEPTMARTQIVKQLWAYIRKNNLQDPSNKRKIICNDELRLVFETDCTDMFKMNKLLAKHIIPLESTKDPGSDSKKLKVATEEVFCTTEHDPGQNLVSISDALASFFGTEEREMLYSEASRRVWDYIKANQLEDPMNPMAVLCDSKLQQLFGCESLSALGIQEMLTRHLFKQS